MKWDDLKICLAVQREGTLSAAARGLGVNQTTVARRLERLETALEARLFERADGRMIATAAGNAVCARAERMEKEALSLGHGLGLRDTLPSGTVRFTSLQVFIACFLAPRLDAFLDAYPAISVELVSSSANLNLSRREADLALRLARPRSGALLARKVGEAGYAVFGAADRFEQMEGDGLSSLPWLGYDETWAHLPEAKWMREQIGNKRATATATDVLTLTELVKSGAGVAVLPCLLGERDPALRRLSGPEPVCRRELWLLSHPENKGVKRIQVFSEWLRDIIRRDSAALATGAP